jgi:hypothetical protein
LFGVYQFNRGERNKTELEYGLLAKKDNLEFERKLWLDRVSTYRTISDLAGKIVAHEKKDQKLDEMIESFLAAYWGLMILVEDQKVETAMIRFHDEIRDYKANRSDVERLRDRADQLITTCRKSIETKPVAAKAGAATH